MSARGKIHGVGGVSHINANNPQILHSHKCLNRASTDRQKQKSFSSSSRAAAPASASPESTNRAPYCVRACINYGGRLNSAVCSTWPCRHSERFSRFLYPHTVPIPDSPQVPILIGLWWCLRKCAGLIQFHVAFIKWSSKCNTSNRHGWNRNLPQRTSENATRQCQQPASSLVTFGLRGFCPKNTYPSFDNVMFSSVEIKI